MYKKVLIDILNSPEYRPKTYQELLDMHPVLSKNASNISLFIRELIKRQILYRLPDGTYMLAKNLCIGRFEQYNKYYGFVVPSNKTGKDLYIHQRYMNEAIHGDYVIAREILGGFPQDGKAEGTIVYIVEEKPPRILGTLKHCGTYGFVIPDNPSYPDVFIPGHFLGEARNNHKVVVEITKRQTNGNKDTKGRIVDVLGYPDEPGVDILSIVANYPISTTFSAEALKEANRLPEDISERELKEELKHRADLRDATIITIDGENTKDFDDAISIQKTEDGKYLLGVHIADVAHYVKEGSPLDKEARKRGTSIYLADRVIPMLPEKLSNGLCSLKPQTDRFALSCFMKIDQHGKVLECKILESVIRVKERMTYPDVNKLIERTDEALVRKYRHILTDIDWFYELSTILQQKRRQRGAIDFDLPEPNVIVDANGKAIDIEIRGSDKATSLIEELMIVCNETVSEYFSKKGVPLLYRIHEKPPKEKIDELFQFMEAIHYPLESKEVTPKMWQTVLEQAKKRDEYEQIRHVLLRTLSKARYSPEAKGHFGMASVYYSHFTSPIRRYPDLQIHRIIKEYLHQRLTEERIDHYKKLLPEVAKETTEAEILATRCEMEVQQYKICEYMQDKVGETLEGTVSGVTEHGIFVVLPNQVEGFIPAVKLNTDEDTFYFDSDTLSYISHDKRKVYTFGTPFRVTVANVSLSKRKIHFLPADREE